MKFCVVVLLLIGGPTVLAAGVALSTYVVIVLLVPVFVTVNAYIWKAVSFGMSPMADCQPDSVYTALY